MTDRPIPFPGLRPFAESEEHLFFGRENQVDAMVDKLAASRFLAVIGPSGSGKSSLVNCGLQPALHRGLMASAGSSWKVAKFRPGKDPMRAMARSLSADGFLLKDFGGGFSLEEVVDTHLRVSKRGLLEVYKRARLPEHTNLLVIVDQFEEFFRYAPLGGSDDVSKRADATAFINLLLEPSTQRELPVFVAITMRSDFLGDCSQFHGLPDAINNGQYLVPRMTREERRLAVKGPVGVGQAEISPVLLTRLVNDVGDNPDQLSILQHALNRTWSVWSDSGLAEIELKHYEQTGSMAAALDNHAEEAYAKLKDDRQRQICEKLFKAVSDLGTDARGIRRPTVLSEICQIASADPAEVIEVIEVIDHFRDANSSFLMPPSPEPLELDTVIDISHESLMRVWNRLIDWTVEEAKDAERYQRLAKTAALFDQGGAELLSGAELELMLKWRDELKPNAAWAERYHSNFDKADGFLNHSVTEARKRKQIKIDERQKAEQLENAMALEKAAAGKRKYIYAGLGLVVAAAILSAVVTQQVVLEKTAENEDSQRKVLEKEIENKELLDLQNELKKEKEAAEKARDLAENALEEARARVEIITKAATSQSNVKASEQEVSNTKKQLDTAKSKLDKSKLEDRKKYEKEVADKKAELATAKQRADEAKYLAEETLAEAFLDAVGANVIKINDISYTDNFDVSQGSQILNSSIAANSDQPDRMFGGGSQSWAEDGVTFFKDGKPAGFVHWIEWQTAKNLTLNSVKLFAIHDDDSIGYRYRRAFSNFKLKVKINGHWEQVITYSPSLPYGGNAEGRADGTALAVCLELLEEVEGREFRAEFTQAVNILKQYSSPRVVELDGRTASCSSNKVDNLVRIDDLIKGMLSGDRDVRRLSTQKAKDLYSDDSTTISKILEQLNLEKSQSLSPPALVNLLFLLANSDASRWSPEQVKKTKAVIEDLRETGVGIDASKQLKLIESNLDTAI